MHRVDTDGNVSGLFSDGVPGTSPATVVDAAWLNDLQENIITLLTSASVTPVKGTYTQVRDAILSLFDVTTPNSGSLTFPATGYFAGSGTAWYEKTRHIRIEMGVQYGSSSSPGVTIAQLPGGFEPPRDQLAVLGWRSDPGGVSPKAVFFKVLSTGAISVLNEPTGYATNSLYSLSVTLPRY